MKKICRLLSVALIMIGLYTSNVMAANYISVGEADSFGAITVTGQISEAKEGQVSILITNSKQAGIFDTVRYANETTADSEGNYSFKFKPFDSGIYNITVMAKATDVKLTETVEVANPHLYIDEYGVLEGKSVSLDVKINGGHIVKSGSFDIDYDENAFEFVSITSGDVFAADGNNTEGVLSVDFNKESISKSKDQKIATIELKAKNGIEVKKYEVQITDVELFDKTSGKFEYTTSNGKIDIITEAVKLEALKKAQEALKNIPSADKITVSNYDETVKAIENANTLMTEAREKGVSETEYDSTLLDNKKNTEEILPQILVKKQLVDKFNNISALDVEGIIKSNGELLKLPEDTLKLYNEIENKSSLYDGLADYKNYKEVEDITDRIGYECADYYLKNSTWGQIGAVIEKLNWVYKFDLEGDFAELSNDEKSEVYKALTEDGVTMENVVSVFDKAVEDAEEGSGSSNSDRGGSSPSKSTKTPVLTPLMQGYEPEPTVPAVSDNKVFGDIDNDAVLWARESILFLADKGILNGDGNGNFNPLHSVKREEFTKMIVELFDMYDNNAECSFVDVDSQQWHYKYIASAFSGSIITGIDANNFGVGKSITREDMAVMIYRTVNAKNYELPVVNENVSFDDDSQISDYAKEAVHALSASGIINGMGDGNFAPKQECTRAQAAKIIAAVYNVLK